MKIGMGQNSWILGVRGVVAILFGLYALFAPWRALPTLILVFGVCVLVEGVLGIVAAVRVHDHSERSLPIALEGIVCIVVGLLALLSPDAAALAWLYLVSGFVVVSGILHMAGAIQLRKHFAGEWNLDRERGADDTVRNRDDRAATSGPPGPDFVARGLLGLLRSAAAGGGAQAPRALADSGCPAPSVTCRSEPFLARSGSLAARRSARWS